jgi:hypothetical protein
MKSCRSFVSTFRIAFRMRLTIFQPESIRFRVTSLGLPSPHPSHPRDWFWISSSDLLPLVMETGLVGLATPRPFKGLSVSPGQGAAGFD